MADTKKKVETKAPAPAKKVADKKEAKEKGPKKPPSVYSTLGNGLYKYGRKSRVSLYTFIGKRTPKKQKTKKKLVVEKPIGGEKNGGKRLVSLVKKTKSYPTTNRIRQHPSKKCFKEHRRYVRSSLQPGTIVILLAGVHKGHRAILLKQLKSGLLLITGPFSVNGVPLRRVHQSYVIATSSRIDVSKVKIPDSVNDAYFKRVKAKKTKKDEGDIFVSKKESYKPSEQRKKDQKEIDKQVVRALNHTKDHKLLNMYLRTMFGLRSNQYPHKMKF